MLRKRFIDYPQALVQHLQPMNSSRVSRQISLAQGPASDGKAIRSKQDAINAIKFAPIWNEVIKSLREEDLINNKYVLSSICTLVLIFLFTFDLSRFL
jgi:hypothetical protein